MAQAQRCRVSAKSRLGEKLTYIHKQWDGLQTFLTDSRVEIDFNRIENLVRTRSSRATTKAAPARGCIASLTEPADNGVEPFA